MLAHSTSDHAIAVTNELAQCRLHPTVATSPQHARTLVEDQGAAIVPGTGPSEQDARNLAYDLLGSKVLAVTIVRGICTRFTFSLYVCCSLDEATFVVTSTVKVRDSWGLTMR